MQRSDRMLSRLTPGMHRAKLKQVRKCCGTITLRNQKKLNTAKPTKQSKSLLTTRASPYSPTLPSSSETANRDRARPQTPYRRKQPTAISQQNPCPNTKLPPLLSSSNNRSNALPQLQTQPHGAADAKICCTRHTVHRNNYNFQIKKQSAPPPSQVSFPPARIRSRSKFSKSFHR